MHCHCGCVLGGQQPSRLRRAFARPCKSQWATKKRGGRAYRVSFLGGAWLASSAALSALVFLLSGAIRLIDGGRIDVDGGVHTSVSCLSLPSPLLSSPFSFLSSPPVLLRAVQLRRRGHPGVSSGACLPGRQRSMALACGRAYGLGCGHCVKPCHRRVYGVASIGRGAWCGVWWWCGRWWWEGRSDVAMFEPQLPHLGQRGPWAAWVGYILLSYSENNACIAQLALALLLFLWSRVQFCESANIYFSLNIIRTL